MSIIGCDLHSRYQVVAMVDTDDGEVATRRLEHENGEARTFYAGLAKGSRVGIEATGYTQWFERLLAELGHELWVGDPAAIRARAVRRQKTDTRDAEHLLDLLVSRRFPRVWVPSVEQRDLRQLLKHRDKLVRMRTALKNQLHFLAMSQGVCRKQKLWSARGRAELEGLSLGAWADSSGGHQRLGHISKQGNQMLRWLLVEAGQRASLLDEELRRKYKRLAFRRGRNVAKVAMARQLAVRLYWKLRQARSAQPAVRMPGSPR